ncbi:MAG: hypothetical protein GX605_13665, partial [Chloroflexi bacterium]|nr:hypothetical protein [Chloroflexota bacterium]
KTEVVDEFTFRLTHEKPWARFLDSISEGFLPMWSPTAVEKYGPDEFQRHLIGTGPFMVQEYKPGDYYVFVKNPDYNWAPSSYQHSGPAYLDKITLRFISEVQTAVAAFKAGEADVVLSYPPQNVPDARAMAGVEVMQGETTGSPVLAVMNITKPPLDDIAVRKALLHVTNQEEVNQVLWRGEAIPTRGLMYPASRCYWKEAEGLYPFDVAKANALLDEAGWKVGSDGIREKDGKRLELVLVNSFTQELGPMVQAQLREVGADVKIDVVSGPIQLERAANGDFHLIFQHMAYADPGVLDMLYNSKNNRPGGWSWTRFVDSKLDELLDESSMTVDLDKRCELLVEAQKIIMDNALVLPIYGSFRIAVLRDNVKGFGFGPRPNVDIWVYDTYMEK